MLEAMCLLLFRTWRTALGRDFCEVCPGDTQVRGNEQIVDGVVMCDDCHARHMTKNPDRSVDRAAVARSLRLTVRINFQQSPQALQTAMLELADLIEEGIKLS